MTDRDLTPAEARAEVEAFFGSEWTVIAPAPDGTEVAGEECYVGAWRGDVNLSAFEPTYRAAVAALKSAWRDAVRPWMEAAIEAKLDTADVDGYAPTERVIDRVCEKGMSNG